MKWFWSITNPPWLVLVPFEWSGIFLGMRLAGVTHWDWWVVASPLWGAFALFWLAVAFFGIVFGLAWKD